MYADVKCGDIPISFSSVPIDLTSDEPSLTQNAEGPAAAIAAEIRAIRRSESRDFTRQSSPAGSLVESSESSSDPADTSSVRSASPCSSDNDGDDESEVETTLLQDGSKRASRGRNSHCDHYTQISYKVYKCGQCFTTLSMH
jgi:hypothetical protein